MYAKGDFCGYLQSFKVEKGCEFTHTSIIKPSGAFYIPGEEEETFFDKYKTAMRNGEELYMTERHKSIGPIVIDLDFRFEKQDKVVRVYTENHVKGIVKVYMEVISSYFEIPEEGISIYVMEKPGPVVDKGIVKDGIHIVIPDLVSIPTVQYMIRNDVLEKIESVLGDLQLRNALTDVIDEAVIHRNNWQMFGSKKPKCEAYKVTSVLKYKPSIKELVSGDIEPEADLVELLSIRNKYDETHLKIDCKDKVEAFENKLKLQQKKMNDARLSKANNKKNVCDNIEFVGKVVDILSADRANKYDEWIRVGWCLRNIDYRLLDKWIDFSKKSSKFVDGECEKVWNLMRDDGLGLGTLYMWAKQDNKDAFEKIIENDLFSLISSSSSKTHHDIGKVIHFLYKYEFVCISIKHNFWYEFKNHRWFPCDSAHTLRSRLSTEVVKKYCAASAHFANKASTEDDADQRDRYTEKSKKLLEIANKLKDCPFKENILKECRDLFYVEKFEEKLDSRCHLIGFENGVYDLEVDEFREGRPEDYISFSTGINYVDYDETCDEMKGVKDFLSKVFTKEDIRDYVMKVLSSFMNGNIREERFHIWTGCGCHAKDAMIMMADGSMKKVQDIQVGEQLMGDDSKPRNVLKLYQGEDDMVEIVPNKGESFIVNKNHILSLKAKDTTQLYYRDDIESWCVSYKVRDVSGDRVMLTKFLTFNEKSDAIRFTENLETDVNVIKDGDVFDISVASYMKMDTKDHQNMYLYKTTLQFDSQDIPIDPYTFGYSMLKENTGLSSVYKINSEENRLKVLAGIFDSIGVYNKITNTHELQTKNKTLKDDVTWLARSLGFNCTFHEDVLSIHGADINFTKSILGDLLQTRFKVKELEKGQYYGFELDSNHRYLMEDFTVTHNSNGKSKIIELYESAFGEYCCKFPITLLTQKRAASNATTSELARAKGKRFGCLQEPSEDEKLNIGLMKELTGGDKIMARALFKEPIEFKPQFKMLLTCNHLPNVPSDDGGTWRRIRVVEFTSKFTDNPDPNNPNEFMIDTELSTRFDDWKEHFMALLIQYYKKYKVEGIFEPEDVMKCTREYQRNNDNCLEFLEQEVEKDDRSFLTANDLFTKFGFWLKDNAPHIKLTTKKHFAAAVEKTLGKSVHSYKVQGWKGFRFKQDALIEADDPLDN